LNRLVAQLRSIKKNGSFEVLMDFVRESFKVSWNGKNLAAVKNLDSMTKDLIIPPRSGSNIINSLTVSYLLLFILTMTFINHT